MYNIFKFAIDYLGGKNLNIALILSGGIGSRFGENIPKQYMKINDRNVIFYCMEQFFMHKEIDAVQIVAHRGWYQLIIEGIQKCESRICSNKFRGFSDPGENRQLSILHGLEDIKCYASDSDIVMIHDAARPLISDTMITSSLNAVEGHDGALPVVCMKDTVYKSIDGKKIDTLLNRSEIYAGQAPETFRFGKYYAANRALLPDRIHEIHGSTEPAVMAGMDIVMIPGDENNIKITTWSDFEHVCELFKTRTVQE